MATCRDCASWRPWSDAESIAYGTCLRIRPLEVPVHGPGPEPVRNTSEIAVLTVGAWLSTAAEFGCVLFTQRTPVAAPDVASGSEVES